MQTQFGFWTRNVLLSFFVGLFLVQGNPAYARSPFDPQKNSIETIYQLLAQISPDGEFSALQTVNKGRKKTLFLTTQHNFKLANLLVQSLLSQIIMPELNRSGAKSLQIPDSADKTISEILSQMSAHKPNKLNTAANINFIRSWLKALAYDFQSSERESLEETSTLDWNDLVDRQGTASPSAVATGEFWGKFVRYSLYAGWGVNEIFRYLGRSHVGYGIGTFGRVVFLLTVPILAEVVVENTVDAGLHVASGIRETPEARAIREFSYQLHQQVMNLGIHEDYVVAFVPRNEIPSVKNQLIRRLKYTSIHLPTSPRILP